MNVQPTDADRRRVEPIMEYAETSDLPEWALTAMRGRAAVLVAAVRAEEGARFQALLDEWEISEPGTPMLAVMGLRRLLRGGGAR